MIRPNELAVWTGAGLTLCVLLLILRRPLAALLRLVLRSSLGLAALAVFARFSPFLGITPGVNLANALVLGLLGLPGFGLLVLLCRILSG